MIYRLLAALAFCLLTWPSAPSAQAIDAAAVRKALAEIMKPGTTEKRRGELGYVLLDAKTADLAAALKTHLRKEEDWPTALDIAINYQLKGMFSLVERRLEAEPERVASLAFATWDKGATQTIIEKWKSAEPGSDLYKKLLAPMLNRPMDFSALDDMYKIVIDKATSETHASDGAKVLRIQTGFDGVTTAEVEFKYSNYMKESKAQFKRHPMTGMDLGSREGWEGRMSAFRTPNYVLKGKQVLLNDHTPPMMVKGKFKVTMWFYSDTKQPDASAGIRLMHPNNVDGWIGIMLAGDKWIVKVDSGDKEVPYVAQTWHKLTFSGEYKDTERKFISSVFLNDKPIHENGVVNARPIGVLIGCNEGEALFSSIDCVRA